MVERDGPTTDRTGPTVVMVLPAGICRRCVRAVSRRVSDLPGVVWLAFDADSGVLRVGGGVDPEVLRRVGFEAYPERA